MEYKQGRLFKDPSLPGMTVDERKVGWIRKHTVNQSLVEA